MLLEIKEETLWESLGERETNRKIISKLRSDTGFMEVWKQSRDFAKIISAKFES